MTELPLGNRYVTGFYHPMGILMDIDKYDTSCGYRMCQTQSQKIIRGCIRNVSCKPKPSAIGGFVLGLPCYMDSHWLSSSPIDNQFPSQIYHAVVILMGDVPIPKLSTSYPLVI